MTARIGIVTNPLDHGMTGPNKALLHICKEISKRYSDIFEIIFIHNEYSDLSFYSDSREAILPRYPPFFEKKLDDLDLDLLYYPHFPWLRPGLFRLDVKKVVHLHGDLPYAIPEFVSLKKKIRQYSLAAFYRKSGLAGSIDRYIVGSRSLLSNKKKELSQSEEKYEIIPLAGAIQENHIKKDRILEEYGLRPRPYMLDVASSSQRKNLIRLIDAVSILVDAGVEVPLLVIVGIEKDTEIFHCGKTKLRDDVKFIGRVFDEPTLSALYRGAEFYVNPTLHEGFGMTNVEAMNAGLPVVTSDRFAVPEVVGDAACLITDPEDPREIAEKIRYVSDNEDVKVKLAEASIERSKNFSWERTVDMMYSTFEDVLEN